MLLYSIVNGTDLPYTIDNKGQIKVSGSIDREVQDIYHFEVWCIENICLLKTANCVVEENVVSKQFCQ